MKRFGHIMASPWQTKLDKDILIGSLVMIAAVVIIEHLLLKGSL